MEGETEAAHKVLTFIVGVLVGLWSRSILNTFAN